MIASIILAVSISSSCITNFMTLPTWMPTSVSSADTFGSADHATASHRVTSNTLAAVEALFDAYYERVYFKSAAGVNDRMWNVREYGPRDFAHMSFTNGTTYVDPLFNYRNGNRTVPDTRRLIEFPLIMSLASYLESLVESVSWMIERNNWGDSRNEDSFWSSSATGTYRLPHAYEWSSSPPPKQSFENRCIPILSYAPDPYLNRYNRSYNYSLYPLPRMYEKADVQYYNNVIQRLLPSLERHSKFTELIDTTFGGSSENGMADRSRRLNPDEHVDSVWNTNSTLIATECRVLAMLDRTYDFPTYKQDNYITNTTKSATTTADYFYYGLITGLSITFTGGASGTFTCDEFTDSDLEFDMSIVSTNVDTECFQIIDSTKDRARFGGTSTSISQSCHTFNRAGSIARISDLFGAVALNENYLGIVDVNLTCLELNRILSICITAADRSNYTLSGYVIFKPELLEGSSFYIYQNIGISRSCKSSWTHPPTLQDAVKILPATLPCGSAFLSGRVNQSTASFLGWICRYWNSDCTSGNIESDVTYGNSISGVSTVDAHTRISNISLSDNNSLRNAYVSSRIENRRKVFELMSEACPDWQNVTHLSSFNEGFISSDHAGERVVINGGSFVFNISLDGYSPGSIDNFVAEIEEVEDGDSIIGRAMKIKRLGYTSGGVVRWFDDSADIRYSISFSVNDEGYGYSLSDSAADMNAVSIDSCSIPMVTTDWNWKALKMSN